MKILYLLFISTIVFGQAFQDSCNNFVQPKSDEIAFYNFNPQYKTVSGEADILQDLANSHDLTVSGWTSAADAEDSCYISAPDYKGGTAIHFDATAATYFQSTSQDFNIGTGDYSLFAFIKFPDYSPAVNVPIFTKYQDDDNRYQFNITTASKFQTYVRKASNNLQLINASSATFTDDNWYQIIIAVDRGTGATTYVNGEAVSATITANSASDADFTGNFKIGTNDFGTHLEGYISQIRFFKRQITPTEVKQLYYLPAGWKTKQGALTKDGWNIGINGNTLKAWIGSGTAQTIAVTSDSTRFNVNLGSVNLSTDSLYIATDTDTVFHALADSTLPDGYQWTLQIDADDRGAYVMVDNLSLTTSAIATESILQHPEWKGWPDWEQ